MYSKMHRTPCLPPQCLEITLLHVGNENEFRLVLLQRLTVVTTLQVPKSVEQVCKHLIDSNTLAKTVKRVGGREERV